MKHELSYSQIWRLWVAVLHEIRSKRKGLGRGCYSIDSYTLGNITELRHISRMLSYSGVRSVIIEDSSDDT